MRVLFILVLSLGVVMAVPTTMNQYPFLAAILYTDDGINYAQGCSGAIITTTAVLSAAHCFINDTPNVRIRVGSSNPNNGGDVHNALAIIKHQNYNLQTVNNDIAVIRTATPISYVLHNVAQASIAGTEYHLDDNELVWAIGWGPTDMRNANYQLHEIQMWTINGDICLERYSNRLAVGDGMLCSNWVDQRDHCQGSGDILIHNNVVVGISSWGDFCGVSQEPVINTLVSRYSPWIQAAAAA